MQVKSGESVRKPVRSEGQQPSEACQTRLYYSVYPGLFYSILLSFSPGLPTHRPDSRLVFQEPIPFQQDLPCKHAAVPLISYHDKALFDQYFLANNYVTSALELQSWEWATLQVTSPWRVGICWTRRKRNHSET